MKTLRALFFFDLYRIFKAFPYFDENDDPSTVPSDRYSRAEIIEFIIKDLSDSYNDMQPSLSDKGRFNKYVAAALLARVALFDHRYELAEKYAGYVIDEGKLRPL